MAVLAAAILALACAVMLAAPLDRVFAHASLLASDPGEDSIVPLPPSRITLTFAEPVDLRLSAIEVTTTDGKRVDRGDLTAADGDRRIVVSLMPLERGTHIVDWKNVSTIDGHPLSGRFAFHVGERSSDAQITKSTPTFPSPLEPPARFLLDAGLLTLTGTFGILAFALRPVRGSTARPDTVLYRLALAATAVALAGAALQLVAQTSATGAAPLDLLRGRWGNAYLLRVTATMAAAGLIQLRRPRLGLAAAALALLTLAITSHGAAIRGLATPAVIADALHIAAVSLWVGGLPGIALLAWTLRRERAEVGATLRRFSTLALISAGIAGLSGSYLTYLQVLRLSAFDTPYGRAVLVKIVFFVGLLALGAVNRRWSLPAFARDARKRLRVTIGIEVALGIGLVAAVAVMTSTLPAREALRPPLPGGVVTTLDGTRIDVRAHPGLPGANEITIDVRDGRGRAVDGAAVAVRAAPVGQEPDLSVAAPNTGRGTYTAPVILGARGIWTVFISVAPREGFDSNASVRVEVGGAPPPRPSPSIAWGWKGFGWLLVVGGAFAAAAADREWAWSRKSRSPWYGASAAAAGLLVLVLAAPRFGEPTSIPAATPATLALGEQVYQTNCQRCHGAGLVPSAEGVADLRLHALMHSDAYFLDVVRNGRPATAMPPFRDTLSDKQIGAVLAYIQDQAKQLPASSNAPSPLPTPAR